MKVRISVTADDITHGTPAEGCACAVWRAVTRALPLVPALTVGIHYVFYYGDGKFVEYKGESALPGEARTFIYRTDRRQPAAPFEFDLDVPDKLVAAVVS